MTKWKITIIRNIFCIIAIITIIHHTLKYVQYYNQQRYKAHIAKKPFITHEPDKKLSKQIQNTQMRLKKIRTQIEKANPIDQELMAKLDTIQQNLDIIYKKHTNNSPALAFLGPLGTVYVILKENQLKTQICDIITDLNIVKNNIK